MMRSCLLTIIIYWFCPGITTAPAQTIRSDSGISYDFDGSDCVIPFRIDDSSAYIISYIFATGEFETPPWGEALFRDLEYRFTAALDTMVFHSEMWAFQPGEHVIIWDGTTQSGLPVRTVPHRYYLFAFSTEPDSLLYQDHEACISLSVSWSTGLIIYPGWYVKYQPVHFTGIHENDVSKAVIVFDKSDFISLNPPLSIGDEIGIFTRENLCAGAVVLHWANPLIPFLSPFLRLTVFGDDLETVEKDGFHEGEPLSIKIWDYQENIEYDAIFQCRDTEPFYTENSEYNVISLEVGNTLKVSNVNDLHSVSIETNYPNPFNPNTTIQYVIPADVSEIVTLKVYDLRGALVKTLVDQVAEQGVHSVIWDGTDKSGNKASSGMYIYKLHAGEFTKSNKMILLR